MYHLLVLLLLLLLLLFWPPYAHTDLDSLLGFAWVCMCVCVYLSCLSVCVCICYAYRAEIVMCCIVSSWTLKDMPKGSERGTLIPLSCFHLIWASLVSRSHSSTVYNYAFFFLFFFPSSSFLQWSSAVQQISIPVDATKPAVWLKCSSGPQSLVAGSASCNLICWRLLVYLAGLKDMVLVWSACPHSHREESEMLILFQMGI